MLSCKTFICGTKYKACRHLKVELFVCQENDVVGTGSDDDEFSDTRYDERPAANRMNFMLQ